MAQPNQTYQAFLLTRNHHQGHNGIDMELWAASENSPIRILIQDQEAVCFLPRHIQASHGRQARVELKTLDCQQVDALYFTNLKDLWEFRSQTQKQNLELYESDVNPVDRYLMERFITGPLEITGQPIQKTNYLEFQNPILKPSNFRPRLKTLSLDIETHGFAGALYSIALASDNQEKVFMLGQDEDTELITYCHDEKSLLENFIVYLQTEDPDIIIGWNVIDFDLTFLDDCCRRNHLKFNIGRNNEEVKILKPRNQGQQTIIKIPGRVVLDGIAMLKMAMYKYDSLSLDAVATEILGKTKLIQSPNRHDEIDRLFQTNKSALAEYNLEDCRLVLEIFQAKNLLDFALERATLSGLPMDKLRGSVAAFDYLYLPRFHRQGYVAPDLNKTADTTPSPGGYVMDSKPGLYENVLLLDFKSLYPSIIRTFHIDPLAMAVPGVNPIPGFNNAKFSRDRFILPKILDQLWQARDEAKQQKNQPLSQAIKILMNSFYGVLGTSSCRFHDPRLASSITLYGQKIIKESIEFIEQQQGLEVIYGDTDSCFVLLGPECTAELARAKGLQLQEQLNIWWHGRLHEKLDLDCFLEIQFETHFTKFLMPTIRGSEKGSKKRYAGLVLTPHNAPKLVFRGLESVRTDWTPLAREFQQELYRRIFLDEPYEDYIIKTAEAVSAGQIDDKLLYRKRLRKPLTTYVKNVPPHVQAARKIQNESLGHWISYVITLNGPEPAESRTSPIDYQHYLDKQLAPAADSILHFLKTSFSAIAGRQMQLF